MLRPCLIIWKERTALITMYFCSIMYILYITFIFGEEGNKYHITSTFIFKNTKRIQWGGDDLGCFFLFVFWISLDIQSHVLQINKRIHAICWEESARKDNTLARVWRHIGLKIHHDHLSHNEENTNIRKKKWFTKTESVLKFLFCCELWSILFHLWRRGSEV